MVIRRVSVRLYVAAAAFVLVIVAMGALVTGLVEARRASDLERRWSRQHIEWHRVQLRHSQLLKWFSPERCGAFRSALLSSVENMGGIQRKLDRYLTSPLGESNRRFVGLKHEHVRLTLAHWELSATLRKTCGSALPPVLYLYSRKSCEECVGQIKILLFMEQRHHPELQVFPVDVDFAPPEQIRRLEKLYAVARLPTSIIAETRHEGFLSRDRLEMILSEDRRDRGIRAGVSGDVCRSIYSSLL